jgi:predicted DNA-binding ribbon-helix-helix protein
LIHDTEPHQKILIHGSWKENQRLARALRTALDGMADDIGISTNALICRIDAARKHANLSSAIRLYVLRKATVAPKERQTMEEARAT